MKRKFLPFITLAFTVATLGISGLGTSVQEVGASLNPLTLLSDDFNDSTYKNKINEVKWTSKTASPYSIHQSKECGFYLDNNTASGNVEKTVIATNRVITGITSFQFDFKLDDACKSSNKWFSVYLANDYSDMYTTYAYAGIFMARHDNILNGGSSFNKGFGFNANLGTTPVKDWITMKISFLSATTGKINACVQGGEFDAANEVSFTYSKSGLDIQNAYLGLSVSNEAGETKFDNFRLEHSGEPIVTDFTNYDPTDPNSDFVYKVKTDIKECTFKVVENGALEFNDAVNNDYIHSNVTVDNPDIIVTDIDVVDLSFNAKIDKPDYKLGIVFGYNSSNENLFKNTLVYEISSTTGVLKEYDKDGNQTLPEASNTNNFESINIESQINIVINKLNGITVTENDKPVSYGGTTVKFGAVNNYFGSIALVMINKGSVTPVNCYVDQLKLKTSSYYVPKTKSVTHNFSNDYWGNEDNPDFYVRKSENEGTEVKDGRLVWKRASDNTRFGSAHQYDNFVLDFKLCAIYGNADETSENPDITIGDKWIGLDLSRSTVDTAIYSSYANLLTYITPKTQTGKAQVALNTDKLSPITAGEIRSKWWVNNIPTNLFKDVTYSDASQRSLINDKDAVCFRYISEGGNITLCLKKACEINYTEIVTYYNLKLQGYFSLCCTGYTYVEIDDFSMSNTSPVFECADNDVPETITKIETEIIYDDQNNPINLSEELKINTGLINVLMIVFASTTGVACGAIAFLIIRGQIKKGKAKKHE